VTLLLASTLLARHAAHEHMLTAAGPYYDDVLCSKELWAIECAKQKVAGAEGAVRDGGDIADANGGAVLCAAGDVTCCD
jgi:hypothetical protein